MSTADANVGDSAADRGTAEVSDGGVGDGAGDCSAGDGVESCGRTAGTRRV